VRTFSRQKGGGKIRAQCFLPFEVIQRIEKLKKGFSELYRMKITTSQVMEWIIVQGLPLIESKLREEQLRKAEEPK